MCHSNTGRGLRAATVIAFAALCTPAFAQFGLPGLPTDACHVIRTYNPTKARVLVTIGIATSLPVPMRLGAGWVEACSSRDWPLPPTARCGIPLTVRGEVKDPNVSPQIKALQAMNPEIGPDTIDANANITTTEKGGNAVALVSIDGKAGWKPIAFTPKPPSGCESGLPPVAPPAPGAINLTFNNTTTATVAFVAAGPQGSVAKACIPPGQARTFPVPPSTAYKMEAQPMRDAGCQQSFGSAVAFGAQPINGAVTLSFVQSFAVKTDQATIQVPTQPGIETQVSLPTANAPTGK